MNDLEGWVKILWGMNGVGMNALDLDENGDGVGVREGVVGRGWDGVNDMLFLVGFGEWLWVMGLLFKGFVI